MFKIACFILTAITIFMVLSMMRFEFIQSDTKLIYRVDNFTGRVDIYALNQYIGTIPSPYDKSTYLDKLLDTRCIYRRCNKRDEKR